ncbi:MAG: twin-arginine translocase subunit TatC, partial [Anaerolineales bacterium]
MPLLAHLGELRMRILRMAIAVGVASAISLAFADRLLLALVAPYGGYLQVLEPTESISVWLRVGLTTGLALASPYILLQILGFLAPGLERSEKRVLYSVVPGALFLFALGAAFAWFIMIPAAINFLANFLPDIFRVEWSSRGYVPFVLSLTLWIGISFEMPLVFMFLAWLGVVTPKMLIRGWRFAIVAVAIVAAAITPTVDPFNMLLVMAPLLGLYLISIILAVGPYRSRR